MPSSGSPNSSQTPTRSRKSKATARSTPGSSSRLPRSAPSRTVLRLLARSGAGQLDPDSVRVFDVGEPTVPLGKGPVSGPGPFLQQLPVGPLDILALERDVVQLVPVAIGSGKELGGVRVPVQLEHLLRPDAAKLRPFAPGFRDVLTPDDLHPQDIAVKRNGTIHVADLDPDIDEGVAHENPTGRDSASHKRSAATRRRATLVASHCHALPEGT